MKRYPLEPLARALGIELDLLPGRHHGDRRDGVPALYALVATIDDPGWQAPCERTVRNWRRYGIPGDLLADLLAVKLTNRHPAEIWGDWFE